MTGANLAKDARSRMTRHEPLRYGWRGQEPPHLTDDCDDRFIRELAELLANQQFLAENLDWKNRDKYMRRTRMFIKQKMDRIREGHAYPRSDIRSLELAGEQGIPLFEMRWHRTMYLRENPDEHIRQYCAEPDDMPGWVFGLVVHFKNVNGQDEKKIHEEQDEHIRDAIARYRDNARIGWSRP